MNNLVEHIERAICSQKLCRHGHSILVAVSGGLDSMVLLHVLHRLSAKFAWRLTVVHLNHQLRGRSSNADERLVRQTAAALKLPLVVERAAVKQFAARHGLSVEMAARQLRHELFARTARNSQLSTLPSSSSLRRTGNPQLPSVALAHHADDQVELFFLRVLRGAGGEGLAGMKWVTELSTLNSQLSTKLRLVRPLLDLDKAALATFARQHHIKYREDASNRAVEFQRNRIRHELLPLLRKHYQPALGKTTIRLMEIVGEEAEFVTQSARAWLTSHLPTHSSSHLRPLKRGKGERGKGGRMPGSTLNSQLSTLNFLDLPIAVQRRVLQLQLLGLGVIGDFDLIEKFRASANESMTVNPQQSVYRDSAGMVHSKKAEATGFDIKQTTLDLADRKRTLVFDGLKIRWRIEQCGARSFQLSTLGCEYFDAQKIGSPIVLRHWRPGDRFQPIGMASTVKLQNFFTNRKIPRHERRRLIVAVTATGELFWVEGMRISELFKLDKQTIHRLKWEWRRL